MKGRKVAFTVFFILCLLCVFQAWYYFRLLPDRVPSHFGTAGLPDSWTMKSTFIGYYLLIVAGLAAIFSLIGRFMYKIPKALMSLPNREYWLSEERREKTLDLLTTYFFVFASATMILLLDIFYQAFLVALEKSMILPHPVVSLGSYIGFTLLLTIGVLVRFLRKKEE